MKTSYEMIDSLFSRKEHYEKKRKRNARLAIGIASSLCCVCMVTLLCFALTEGMFSVQEPFSTVADAIHPGIQDCFDETAGETRPQTNNKITVHQVEELPAGFTELFCLFTDDFVKIETEDLSSYYGTNVFPSVPSDMSIVENKEFPGYYVGDNGEVYWDHNSIEYSSEDRSSHIFVGLITKPYPTSFPHWKSPFWEKGDESFINEIEVMICQADDSFSGQFVYRDVGYYITSQGLTLDEFVSVVSSLIQ